MAAPENVAVEELVAVRDSTIATHAGSSAVSIPAPLGTVTGDVVVVVVSANGASTTITDNNGGTPFTEDLNELTQSSHTLSVFSRRIQGGDPSTYAFTLGSSQRWTAVAVTFQHPHATVIYDVTPTATANPTAGTTVNAPSIDTVSDYAIHCAVCTVDGVALHITGTPTDYIVRQNSGDQVVAFTTKDIPIHGTTGTAAFTHDAGTGSFGVSFAIRAIAVGSDVATAINNRLIYPEPSPPPTLGPAGYQFVDPTFSSRMVRITDANTMTDLGQTNFSYHTSAAGYQQMWNAASNKFYLQVSGGSNPILYEWNPTTLVATRRTAVLNFFADVAFHDSDPNLLYGASTAAGATNVHTIVRADASTTPPTYSIVVNLDTIIPGLAAMGTTYTGTVAVNNGNLLTICGGVGQDLHRYCVWYPLANPAAVKVLDTMTRVGMDHFTMHSAQLDKGGRFIDIVPSTGSAAPYRNYIWDTTLDTIVAVTANSGGHESLGFGARINQDQLTVFDSMQWILTPDLIAPNSNKRELINPVLLPQEIYIGEHSSWHCAISGTLVPFVVATFRYGDGPQDSPPNLTPFRAWDNEVLSIRTDGTASEVWRHCHNHVQVYRETGIEASNADIFWYTPRANVSPDGRWILFTSNWGKTLGSEAGSTLRRQDVFLVERLLNAPTLVITRTYRRATKFR